MNIILIILVFGVIIFFHELGHFVVAKINHITVLEFSMGYGPKLFSFTKKETKYTLRLIPLGGYCMMLHDDDEEHSDGTDENSFDKKSVWARMATILAGPAMNFIIAFLFSMIIIHFCGSDPADIGVVYNDELITEYEQKAEECETLAEKYTEEGKTEEAEAKLEEAEYYTAAAKEIEDYFKGVYPAEEAGIQAGDKVVRIEGSNVKNFRELQIYLQIYGDGSPINLTLERTDGTEYETTVYPAETPNGYKVGIISVGYQLPESFGELCKYAALETRYWVKATFLSLKLIVTRQVSSDEVSGPIGVAKSMNNTFNEAAKSSMLDLLLNWLNYIVLLSANLGVMNLLPIPGLDGGRFLFLLIELITRKPVPKDKENMITLIGFILVMALMVVILFNDIKNVFF